jgi:hypothetical protein
MSGVEAGRATLSLLVVTARAGSRRCDDAGVAKEVDGAEREDARRDDRDVAERRLISLRAAELEPRLLVFAKGNLKGFLGGIAGACTIRGRMRLLMGRYKTGDVQLIYGCGRPRDAKEEATLPAVPAQTIEARILTGTSLQQSGDHV